MCLRWTQSSRAKDALRVVARAYPGVNLRKPKDYFDDTLEIDWGSLEPFEVTRQLGKGGCELYTSPGSPTSSALRGGAGQRASAGQPALQTQAAGSCCANTQRGGVTPGDS